VFDRSRVYCVRLYASADVVARLHTRIDHRSGDGDTISMELVGGVAKEMLTGFDVRT
jgi:hypothetical protein